MFWNCNTTTASSSFPGPCQTGPNFCRFADEADLSAGLYSGSHVPLRQTPFRWPPRIQFLQGSQFFDPILMRCNIQNESQSQCYIYIYVYVIYQVYNIILYRHMNHIEINQFPAQFPMTFTLLWGWTCCYGPGPSSNDPRAAPGHPAPWTVPWNLWASTCAEQWPAWIIEKASHENGQFAGGLRLLY